MSRKAWRAPAIFILLIGLCPLRALAQTESQPSEPLDDSSSRFLSLRISLLPLPSFAQISTPSAAGGAQATQPGQTEPSLDDLGLGQVKSDPAEQARLDKRSHMLKMHQRFGLITIAPLAATLISSGLASGKSTSSTGRDLHAALGVTTVSLYSITAYYAIFAPKIAGTPKRGPIRLHRSLAFVHGTGMILTPILGAMAFDQKSKGEKVHGIASAHGAVAAITGISYGLAIASVSLKF
jgi:hypothetical protein